MRTITLGALEVNLVRAANQNHASSGQRRCCSTSTIDNESMALMQCPSVLSAPTLMGHFYTLNATWQPPHTMRRWDVVLAATPNQHSSGQGRACSTSTIDNESMALMQCPSVLSAPTLSGYFYAYNAILQPPHTMRRVVEVLAATPKHASSMHLRGCTIVNQGKGILRRWYLLPYYPHRL